MDNTHIMPYQEIGGILAIPYGIEDRAHLLERFEGQYENHDALATDAFTLYGYLLWARKWEMNVMAWVPRTHAKGWRPVRVLEYAEVVSSVAVKGGNGGMHVGEIIIPMTSYTIGYWDVGVLRKMLQTPRRLLIASTFALSVCLRSYDKGYPPAAYDRRVPQDNRFVDVLKEELEFV